MKANEKLKMKAIEYQNSNKYSGNRDGKLCFNKSIYSGLYMCGKCGKNYNFKINNRNKPTESRIFVCASNKSRKVCENGDMPLDVIDLITIKAVNRIIVNKHNFIKLLEESFEEKNSVIYKQQEIESIMAQINELQAKFNKYKDIDDEFYKEVNKAYEQKLKPLYKKKVMLENEISTATGVNDYLYQFKKAIIPLNKTITSLEDLPLNKIFSKIIIHDRDHVTFVLGTCKSISDIKNMDKDILIEEEPYYIRKTKHNLKFGIYIN